MGRGGDAVRLTALLQACLGPGPRPYQADHLLCSAAQLLQASFREEEVPQVGVLSLRHRGDDGFFVAFLTQIATQRIHGLYPTAEERPLKLSVSHSVADSTFGA